MDPDDLRYHIRILAVSIKHVIQYDTYLPAPKWDQSSTARNASKKVCSNCQSLLSRLKKSGPGCRDYDWWYNLKGALTSDAEITISSQLPKDEHDRKKYLAGVKRTTVAREVIRDDSDTDSEGELWSLYIRCSILRPIFTRRR